MGNDNQNTFTINYTCLDRFQRYVGLCRFEWAWHPAARTPGTCRPCPSLAACWI